MAGTIRVLHVDDDPDFTELTATFLERENARLSVTSATDTREGMRRLDESDIDCIVSDYDMPGQTGIDFLESAREEYTELPFILFTGKGSEEVAADAISAGATDYIQKELGTGQYTVLANRITNSVEQHRARRRSERANRRRRQTLTRITDGFVEMDADLTVTDVNEQTVELTGLSRETLLGVNYRADIAEADDNPSIEGYEQVIETGEPQTVEALSDINEGRWIEERIFPTEDRDGVYVYFQDITERKERERKLQTQTRQLQGVLDSVQAALWMRDTENRFILANQNYRELFDIDSETDLAGVDVAELFDQETVDRLRETDQRVLSHGEPIKVEEEVETAYGTRVYLARITPLFDDDGEVFATAGAAVDITERKERERTLTALHTAAQKIEQSEDEQTVYKTLVETAENVLQFDLVAVDVERDGSLVQEVWRFNTEGAGCLEKTSLDSDDTFAARAYNRQETITVDDLREADTKTADDDYRSALTVPIGRFGTLQAASSEVGAFDEYDREFAELLVEHARVKLDQLAIASDRRT
ncbi:PAS domain-containing protein [Haloferax larsenii]|uniref:PAS domain S-box-containing protein n=1 Tax=Haloferax larsenii TaxID=302484 RepID=A0A1H7KH58_HALLR|nr:PAS domain-containing protein [Haloferax larsenii]SEK86191.1 PAS domain S-box-containing protein [Haloferax larsenii]